jgi:hypothetical protein
MVLYFYELCCSNCSRILAVLRASPFHIDPKRIRVQIFTNLFSSFCCENIAVIGYTVRFRHISKCQPQMTLSTGNYYDVIFLPKWRTQIWGKIDLGGHRFEWEAIPKDKDLHGKRTRIWGYSNFIGHRFVERHRFEERTRIWGRAWIWVLYIYICVNKRLKKLPTYEPTGCRIGNKC